MNNEHGCLPTMVLADVMARLLGNCIHGEESWAAEGEIHLSGEYGLFLNI